MEVEGQTQEFRATSSVDVDRGEMVRIVGVAGNGLIVDPQTKAVAGDAEDPASTPDSDG